MTDSLGFDGRVAIVTGGGRGIGRSVALLLASRNAKVIVNDIGCELNGEGFSKEPATKVVELIIAAGGTAAANFDDVSTMDGGASVVEQATDSYGSVDVLINNAGVSRPVPFEDMTWTLFEDMLRANVGNHFHATRAAWPHMVRQNYGRIVLTTSAAGFYGLQLQSHYAAAKAALHGLMRCLAIEGKSHNIQVNEISPEAFTRMSAKTKAGAEVRAKLEKYMKVELAAPLFAFLAHERCAITGEVFESGGGRVARVIFAEGPGFIDPDISVESIANNLDTVLSDEGYILPQSGPSMVDFATRMIDGSRGDPGK